VHALRLQLADLRTQAPGGNRLPAASEDKGKDTAMRAANLGYALYPRSSAVNGILGVLTILGGDAARGRALLKTSVELDSRGYASANNLLNIANFLANGETKPAAVTLLQVATELYPADPRLKTRLEDLD